MASQLLAMYERVLRKKLRKKDKKAQRRRLAEAIEEQGHHAHEQKRRSKR